MTVCILRMTKYSLIYKPAKARNIYMTLVPLHRLLVDNEEVLFQAGIARFDTNNQILEGLMFSTDGKVLS